MESPYKITVSLTKSHVLNKISQYELFSYYLGCDFKSGVVMNSPLRQDDKPSFSIFTDRKGTLRFKDFGTGDTGDCFTLIQQLFGIDFHIQAIFGQGQLSPFKDRRFLPSVN